MSKANQLKGDAIRQADILERYPQRVQQARDRQCTTCRYHGNGVDCVHGMLPVTMSGDECIYYSES